MSAAWSARPSSSNSYKLIETGAPNDPATYEACLKRSIAEVVRQQAETGVDIVSDGELSKGRNWAFYTHDLHQRHRHPAGHSGGNAGSAGVGGRRTGLRRLSGILCRVQPRHRPGARLGSRFVVNGPLAYETEVKRDIANLKGAAAKANAHGGFLPVVAPASALPGAKNEHYPR